MRVQKLFVLVSILIGLFITQSANAMLSLELTQGVSGAIPIAVASFSLAGSQPSQDVSGIVSNDLQNSGRFKVFSGDKLSSQPSKLDDVNFSYFQKLGANNIVIGQTKEVGDNRYEVHFQLLDAFHGKDSAVILNLKYTVPGSQLRQLAHHISDLVYQKITGNRGVFSTRLAYVLVQRGGDNSRYILEVADQDGFSPKPLLTSTDPIMSPAWSPNGKQIAYVSFENQSASIYVQNVLNGSRSLVSKFPGINGAPAWSPDGRKLAVVLSKSGSPNIYVLDLASHGLTQLTKDFNINTEPCWSPDGRNIIFTSNRSGGNPQVYEMNVANKSVKRVTYEGSYNARPSFAPDGNHIVMINRDSGMYNIGLLDLNNGNFKVLTNSTTDHGSPSLAPNGSMVVFEMYDKGQNVLGMTTTDGTVNLRLPARNGEVQDPAWSPFLS